MKRTLVILAPALSLLRWAAGCAPQRQEMVNVPGGDANVTLYSVRKPDPIWHDPVEFLALRSGPAAVQFYRDGTVSVSDGRCAFVVLRDPGFRDTLLSTLRAQPIVAATLVGGFLANGLNHLPGAISEQLRPGGRRPELARRLGAMLLSRPAVVFSSASLECELRLTEAGRARLRRALNAPATPASQPAGGHQ